MRILDFIILVDTNARMNLKAETSKLYLSFLWWILEPMLYVAIFYFVFSVLLGSREMNFLLFLMCGKIPYMWFSKTVTNASASISNNRGIISQVYVSKLIFPYASIQTSTYKEIPVFIFLFAACIYFGHSPSLLWLWLIPLVISLYLMIVACSLLAALVVCYVEDMRVAISMGMTALMFTSGVFLDISTMREPVKTYLLAFNPMAFFCDAFRAILMRNEVFDAIHLLKLTILFVCLIALLHWLYQLMSKAIAARVVNA